MITDAVNQVKISAEPPVALVGGGVILLKDQIDGAATLTRPDHRPVVGAVGATITDVGREADRVFSLETTMRDAVLAEAQRQAEQKTTAAGARPGSGRVVYIDEVGAGPYAGYPTRVRVKAVGELDVASGSARGASSLPIRHSPDPITIGPNWG